MSERAVVLAGGQGARLRPFTWVIPKPLMPVGDYPILEFIVRQLARDGFRHITLAVNYRANLIKAFFEDGARWNVKIDYSLETESLSTIAPLRLVPDLPPHFLLLNGDVLTDMNFGAFLDRHCQSDRLFTVAAAERTHVSDYGVLSIDSANVLTGFSEKPATRYLVSMGVYGVSRRVVDLVPAGRKFGFDDLMLYCLAHGHEVKVEPYAGYWLDIGRPEDHAKAMEDADLLKTKLLGDG